jgi:RNA polymerase sigma-70 factor (ECF subfamily)
MKTDDNALSDEVLLSGIAIGDERSGLVFVRRYQHRLYGLALAVVLDSSEAEDVAQEAFIRIFRHAQVFDARRGSVSSWALTITRNLAIDSLRLRRGIPTDPSDRVFLELTSPFGDAEATAHVREDRRTVLPALMGLPIDQRRAVVLAAMYGWTAEEIAHVEGIALGTAKGRIRLGMAKLRRVVIKEETT